MACKEKSSNWSQHKRKVTDASEKDMLAVKQIMTKFNGGETWSAWHIEVKSEMRNQ
jgi:predicted secreted protein